MSQGINRTLTVLLAIAVVILGVVVARQYARNTWTSIQISFAEEQTRIFCDLTSQATEALNRRPPDVLAAVECLNGTQTYYPSSSKQTPGSFLDRIVERSRSTNEARIIDMLRSATGDDPGAGAEDWVRKYGNKAGSSQ